MKQEEVFKLAEEHYRAHHDSLVKTMGRIMGSHHDAEDVVQDAYTWSLHNWEKFDPDRGTFDLWFLSPLRHSIRNKKRDQHTHGISETPLDFYMRSISI